MTTRFACYLFFHVAECSRTPLGTADYSLSGRALYCFLPPSSVK